MREMEFCGSKFLNLVIIEQNIVFCAMKIYQLIPSYVDIHLAGLYWNSC